MEICLSDVPRVTWTSYHHLCDLVRAMDFFWSYGEEGNLSGQNHHLAQRRENGGTSFHHHHHQILLGEKETYHPVLLHPCGREGEIRDGDGNT